MAPGTAKPRAFGFFSMKSQLHAIAGSTPRSSWPEQVATNSHGHCRYLWVSGFRSNAGMRLRRFIGRLDQGIGLEIILARSVRGASGAKNSSMCKLVLRAASCETCQGLVVHERSGAPMRSSNVRPCVVTTITSPFPTMIEPDGPSISSVELGEGVRNAPGLISTFHNGYST